ncbi:MAG: DNA primase family protein [Thermoplasmatota archaeon]
MSTTEPAGGTPSGQVGCEPVVTVIRSAGAYFEGKQFRAQWLARDLMDTIRFITFTDTKEIYYYDEGVYHPLGEPLIHSEVERVLGEEATVHRVDEVENHIRRSTFVGRESIAGDAELLCVRNGILHLTEKTVGPHTPDQIFLNRIPVVFDPDAECPQIQRFISEVVDAEDIPVVQEIFGYCLWRRSDLDKAVMFVGEGSNGKSTLIELLVRLLGVDNVSGVSLQQLEANRFATAELYGKLANVYADLTDESLRHTGTFKMLVGGDLISAERKFKSPFKFYNCAKLIYSCNKVPETRDDTTAFYRRWIIINFTHVFVRGEDEDPTILDKITSEEELSGLLNWALEGLARLLKQGQFTYSPTVDALRQQYMMKSNPVQAFVETHLEVDPMGEILKSDLYQFFVEFCKEVKLPVKANNVFGKELPSYINVRSGQKHGKTVWYGIKYTTKSPELEESEKSESENDDEENDILDDIFNDGWL